MPSPIRAVIFDAGFTLIEPKEPVVEVYLREARAVGASLDAAAFGEHFKNSWKRSVRDFRSAHPELDSSDELERAAWNAYTKEVARPFPDLAERHGRWLERLFAHFDSPESWRAMSGAVELLESLRLRELELGVLSNWHSALHRILAALDLDRRLDFILTSADVGKKKPHGRMFGRALEAAGTAASETMHVGDSIEDDVEGAVAMGLRPVLFTKTRPPTFDLGIPSIERLDELTTLIDGSKAVDDE